jgi:hypothetical protein
MIRETPRESSENEGGHMQFDESVLREGMKMPRDAHRVWNDGERYMCFSCGATWKPAVIRLWWPIVGVAWARHFRFGTHGIEVGAEAIERRRVQTVLSIGWLRVTLGRAS